MVLTGLLFSAVTAHADEYAERRAELVAEVQRYASIAGDPDRQFGQSVIEALTTVERHKFVPENLRPYAYENRPLSIGHGQTISQPYIVALMTELIDPQPGDIVLEVGTGSGYQAAVLAEIVDHVYTIEIIEPLFETTTVLLQQLGYDNVTTRLGDGYYGWEEHAPYDAILVTAAPNHVPPALVEQLGRGGRMVMPIGGHWATQQLLLIQRTDADEIVTRQVTPVRFVPLTGEH